jgi:hypothetical protein
VTAMTSTQISFPENEVLMVIIDPTVPSKSNQESFHATSIMI